MTTRSTRSVRATLRERQRFDTFGMAHGNHNSVRGHYRTGDVFLGVAGRRFHSSPPREETREAPKSCSCGFELDVGKVRRDAVRKGSTVTAINPYQSPVAVASSHDETNNAFAIFIYVTGFLCALVASIGALGRCLIEVIQLDFSVQSLSNDPSALIAICTLAFATGLSFCLYGFVRKYVAQNDSTYCQCLLLIAMLAMCTRAMLDPTTCWTPTWQTYVLTASGVISLGIVLRHVRIAVPGVKLDRQANDWIPLAR